MSTGIEWTDETWNPITGCTEVSPGCDHCYAKTMHERFNGPGSFATVTLHPDRLGKPLRWRKPRKVFVNSMSDLFHKDVPDEYVARVFAIMALAPSHTFQVLTKRHGRMRSLLSRPDFPDLVATQGLPYTRSAYWKWDEVQWPLRNVHGGVSVEDQARADLRVPALLETPLAVRFLSMEPLLGPVSFRWAKWHPWVNSGHLDGMKGIDWVIVGGESGHGARPMHPDWVRTIRDQCVAAGVPFLFKQWGAHDERGRRMAKSAAGRELDGRTWDEFPGAVA